MKLELKQWVFKKRICNLVSGTNFTEKWIDFIMFGFKWISNFISDVYFFCILSNTVFWPAFLLSHACKGNGFIILVNLNLLVARDSLVANKVSQQLFFFPFQYYPQKWIMRIFLQLFTDIWHFFNFRCLRVCHFDMWNFSSLKE